MPTPLQFESLIPGISVRHGKVRDIYDFGDQLLLTASDRISAFDWILPNTIPDKGRVLTQISKFWFDKLTVPHHLISLDPTTLPLPKGADVDALAGRSMVVKNTNVVPIECVVRGYLAGSGWKEYQKSGTVCGIHLPTGLVESSQLPEPIFTPATKAETGHDENISYEQMCDIIGSKLSEQLKEISLSIYNSGAAYAREQGIIIADTKFEFGLLGKDLILIDEVMTPDSSRFWPQNLYEPGKSQPSYDKQFVRDWLESTTWDKNSPPPELPPAVVKRTREKYIEAYEKLTRSRFAWK